MIKERVTRRLQNLDQITTPQEAQAQIAALPLVAVHESRYGLQLLKEQVGVTDETFEILEPISRVIGWVEASAYFMDLNTQREALKTVFQNSGQQLPSIPQGYVQHAQQ